jgi:hypothetical protein
MKPRLLIATICAAALALPVGALARDGASGSFQLDATFGAAYTFVGLAGCPPGTPSTTVECIRFLGTASIPGLGRVTESYTKSFDGTICPDQVASFKTAVFEVAGKGTIEVSMQSWPACADPAATTPTGVTSLLEGTIDHGTGRFAGASGNLKLTNHVNPPSSPLSGSASDIWTGTLVVPGMEFDLTPPVLTGATSKLVKVRKEGEVRASALCRQGTGRRRRSRAGDVQAGVGQPLQGWPKEGHLRRGGHERERRHNSVHGDGQAH